MAEHSDFFAVATDPAMPGMDELADALGARRFSPGQCAMRAQVRHGRQQGQRVVLILPATRFDLVLVAHFAGAYRVAIFYSGLQPGGWQAATRAGLRAAFGVADLTIVSTETVVTAAVRAGADPERIAVMQDVLPRLLQEPARRSRASGVFEVAASLALDGAEATGIIGLVERMTSHRGINVVNYHRVLPVEEARRYWRPQMAISSAVFEAQLEAFSDHRGFAPPERLADPDARGQVAVTFDDGYEDNYRVALPLLQRFSAPACIYLVTGMIGGRDALWWDRVGLGLFAWWRLGAQENLPEPFPEPASRLGELESLAEARTCIADTLSALNHLSEEERRQAVKCAEELVAKLANGLRTMLGWDEVRAMNRCGVRFGSHTRNHTPLDEMTKQQACDELFGGQADLEAQLDSRALKSVALPRGQLGELTAADLEQTFETVMTTEAGLHRPGQDRLFVKRRDGRTLTLRGRHHPAKLRLELTGVLDPVRRWAHRVTS